MASVQSTKWPLTFKALKELEGDLVCCKCFKLVVSPRTFRNCLHFFCHGCIKNSVNCPECRVPSSAKDIYHDEFVEKLTNYVKNIEKALGCLSVTVDLDSPNSKKNADLEAKIVSEPVEGRKASIQSVSELLVDSDADNGVKSVKRTKRKNSNLTPKNVSESGGRRKGSISSVSDLPEDSDAENDLKGANGAKRRVGQRRNAQLSKKLSSVPLKRISDEPVLKTPNPFDDTQNEASNPKLPSNANVPLGLDLDSSVIVPVGKSKLVKSSVSARLVPKIKEGKKMETQDVNFTTPVKNSKENRQHDSLVKNVSDTARKAANKRNAKGETPLQVACKKGILKQVQELIANGANPNVKDNFGWTPLHEAIQYSHIEIVKELIEKGRASVNTPGGENCTPLHKAVALNILEAIKLLLKYGADPNLVDIYGNIPIEYSQSDEVTRMLENHATSFTKYTILGQVSDDVDFEEERVVFFGDGLSKSNQKLLLNLSSIIPGSRVSHSLTPDVTYVVVNEDNGTCNTSANVLSGILSGKNFVSMEWVQHSIEVKSIKHQNCHVVKSTKTYPYANGIVRARTCLRKLLPSIFSGMHFAISSVCRNLTYDNLKKDDIATLVSLGNGQYHSREPDPEAIPIHEKTVPFYANNFVEELTGLEQDHPLKNCSHVLLYQDDDPKNLTQRGDPSFIKYNMAHFKSLPITWFVGCIESFTLLDPSPFL
ncbi:BRCA1-associated RING domain protein 1-like isoform X2 [Ischnura elegans]|nr:BRCA1-associated RING domain protein 1-like isoform X2 [Ischnura elegans]